MRIHTKTFHIRFTEKEYERLCKYAAKAGLPKTTYIRHMIDGSCPRENPREAFWAVHKELLRIGNNLNQLCLAAHRFGSLHAGKLDEFIAEFHQIYLKFFNQVMLSEPMDVPTTLESGRWLAEAEQKEEASRYAKQ